MIKIIICLMVVFVSLADSNAQVARTCTTEGTEKVIEITEHNKPPEYGVKALDKILIDEFGSVHKQKGLFKKLKPTGENLKDSDEFALFYDNSALDSLVRSSCVLCGAAIYIDDPVSTFYIVNISHYIDGLLCYKYSFILTNPIHCYTLYNYTKVSKRYFEVVSRLFK